MDKIEFFFNLDTQKNDGGAFERIAFCLWKNYSYDIKWKNDKNGNKLKQRYTTKCKKKTPLLCINQRESIIFLKWCTLLFRK